MAKIINPTLFTDYFGIDLKEFEEANTFNPTLNVDSKLFIDPMLLEGSSFNYIHDSASNRLTEYFEDIITLLKASKIEKDIAWREADRRMSFHEIPGTCLGYGAASIRGSAFGKKLRARLLKTASQIISLGIEDPKLFILLPLLENDVGPDRISDMTTKIILPDLAKHTYDIANQFGLDLEEFHLEGTKYNLPLNPLETKRTPIILVPGDILSELPVATDWSDVGDAAWKNSTIRNQVSEHIGHIWRAKHRKDKEKLREQVLSSKDAFETLLQLVSSQNIESYNIRTDPSAILLWRQLLKSIAKDHPLTIKKQKSLDIKKASEIVETIIEQFQFIIEERGLAKLLWKEKRKAHHERVSQMIFFAAADSYCKANDLDITPEADTGNGAVDFKFSSGYSKRILVEIKLSKNPNVLSGYEKQLKTYATAEQTMHAYYVVINVGSMGNKDRDLIDIKNYTTKAGKPASEIYFIDGMVKPSASKRK